MLYQLGYCFDGLRFSIWLATLIFFSDDLTEAEVPRERRGTGCNCNKDKYLLKCECCAFKGKPDSTDFPFCVSLSIIILC